MRRKMRWLAVATVLWVVAWLFGEDEEWFESGTGHSVFDHDIYS